MTDKFDEMAESLMMAIDDAHNSGSSLGAGARENTVLAAALRKLDAEARAEERAKERERCVKIAKSVERACDMIVRDIRHGGVR